MRGDRSIALEIAVALAAFVVLVTRVPSIGHFLVNNDHGYQLAAGLEMLRGRFPGVGVFINLGPLSVVFPAVTLYWNHTDLVPEVLMCAAAWAGAVGLAFRFIRRNFGVVPALATAAYVFLCIPRFHKWWVWLVPFTALTIADAARALPGRRRWWAGGFACGVGALIRPDLGISACGALGLIGLVDELRARGIAWPRAWIPITVGFTTAPLLWGMIVLAVEGVAGLTRAASVVPEMVLGTVSSLNLPAPAFRWDEPTSPNTAHALALRLLPITNLLAIAVGWWLYRHRRGELERKGRALIAIGIVGMCSYHHTIYRADIHHLWQGIWPFAFAVPALATVVVQLWRASEPPLWARSTLTAAVTVLLFLGTVGLLPILRQPHFDLEPYGRPPLAGLQELRRWMADWSEHPYALLVDSIIRHSAPSDEVLVLGYAPQLLFFAQRYTHGPTVCFQAGLFDTPAWRRERLAELQRNPPALVVAPLNFFQLHPQDELRASLPEVYDFVSTHYRQVLDRRGRYVLLAPDPMFRPPTA